MGNIHNEMALRHRDPTDSESTTNTGTINRPPARTRNRGAAQPSAIGHQIQFAVEKFLRIPFKSSAPAAPIIPSRPSGDDVGAALSVGLHISELGLALRWGTLLQAHLHVNGEISMVTRLNAAQVECGVKAVSVNGPYHEIICDSMDLRI